MTTFGHRFGLPGSAGRLGPGEFHKCIYILPQTAGAHDSTLVAPWRCAKQFCESRLGSLAEFLRGIRKAGYGRQHDARKKLHGGHVAGAESVRSSGKNFEHAESTAKMTQWRGQNGSHPQSLTCCQIDLWVLLRIVTKYNLAGANTIGRDARIRLKTDS